MSRRAQVERVAGLAGSAVDLVDAKDGWPGLLQVKGTDHSYLVSAHVGPVGLSHRGRDEVERRFQNPGQNRPVTCPPGTIPLLLGVWDSGANGSDVALVGMEVTKHRLNAPTRQSYFVPLATLREAEVTGWSDHHSASDEAITVFHPSLLPVYVEMQAAGVKIPGKDLSSIASAAGIGAGYSGVEADERARRAAQVLIRSRTFSRSVIEAYEGLCAMCGLNFGLLEGAHILPVSVPGAPDEIWNGLALCGNHHGAFDRHRTWINPRTREVVWHPKILEEANQNTTCASFLATTEAELRNPKDKSLAPRTEMFEERYAHFKDAYDWI